MPLKLGNYSHEIFNLTEYVLNCEATMHTYTRGSILGVLVFECTLHKHDVWDSHIFCCFYTLHA